MNIFQCKNEHITALWWRKRPQTHLWHFLITYLLTHSHCSIWFNLSVDQTVLSVCTIYYKTLTTDNIHLWISYFLQVSALYNHLFMTLWDKWISMAALKVEKKNHIQLTKTQQHALEKQLAVMYSLWFVVNELKLNPWPFSKCAQNMFLKADYTFSSCSAQQAFGEEDLLLPDLLWGYRCLTSHSWPLDQ